MQNGPCSSHHGKLIIQQQHQELGGVEAGKDMTEGHSLLDLKQYTMVCLIWLSHGSLALAQHPPGWFLSVSMCFITVIFQAHSSCQARMRTVQPLCFTYLSNETDHVKLPGLHDARAYC